jgi:hypothetical protein
VDDVQYFEDADSDGYGNSGEAEWACEAPTGFVTNDLDCDDTSALFNPSAIEADCEDPNDYNCDGSVGYADADADGFAACTECDDTDSNVHPDAVESCNDVDDNCNGLTDDEDSLLEGASTWYADGDGDGDGYGGIQFTAAACDPPDGYVGNTDDCDDATDFNDLAPSSNPAGTEVCDVSNEDEDCDGLSDDSDPEGASGKATYYTDADSDVFGSSLDAGTEYCDPPAALVSSNNDCDNAAASTHPGASETCDDVDADCDGNLVDSGDDNCHALATCTDDGTGANYSCDCDTGYTGDGVSSCDIDTFPNSTLLSAANKTQINQWANAFGQVWTLCYRKSTDGDSSSTFHTGCNGYSRTITVAQLDSGKLIGGYASTPWAVSGRSGTAIDFLFSLTEGYRIMHCTGQVSCGHGHYSSDSYGPTWGGGHDWYVNSSMTNGHCNLGHDYACQVGSYGNGTCRNDFCGNYASWTIQELEVWGR